MQPSDQPMPFLPKWQNIKVFVLGALWVALISSPPLIAVVWHELSQYGEVQWSLIESVGGTSIGVSLIAYWRKYQALISESPKLVTDRTIVQSTPPGQPDKVTMIHTETQMVKDDGSSTGGSAK